METYREFLDQNNRFRDFYGDTVVFSLEDQVKDKLEKYVNFLYCSAPECFCERLASGTFHMTLHDLSSSTILGDIAEELFENEFKVMKKIAEIQKYNITKIKMRSHYIFNMVNTSFYVYNHFCDQYFPCFSCGCSRKKVQSSAYRRV